MAMFTPAKDNPFAIDHVTALRFRFSNGDWDQHLQRLEELKYRAAVVGPQGSGKTTLLLELKEQLQKRLKTPVGYVRMPNDKASQQAAYKEAIEQCHEKLLLLDSAEKLSWIQWRNVQKKSEQGLIVAVHRPCSLPTWIRTSTTAALLTELVQELGYHDELSREELKSIFESSHGNVRDALRHLYDGVAQGQIPLPPPSH